MLITRKEINTKKNVSKIRKHGPLCDIERKMVETPGVEQMVRVDKQGRNGSSIT